MSLKGIITRPLPGGPFELEGRQAVEIGFGNGEFLAHIAASNPDVTYWGLEIALPCVARAAARLEKAGLTNAHILHGDARFLLRHCFDDDVLERIYMHFPCPWPKKRHARRRVTNRLFADALAATLKVGGQFEFATDEPWYAEEVAEGLGAHPALSLVERRPYQRAITTKYERRWIDEGKVRTLLVFEKMVPWKAPRPLEGGSEEMMHLHVPQAEVSTASLEEKVKGKVGGQGLSHWAFRDVYGSEGIYLLETVVDDEGFEQKFYFKLCNRPSGVLIKPDTITHPFLTNGVRGALAHLAQLLS